MKQFDRAQRVRILDPNHPCFGKTGTVHRKRMRDTSALVRMDEALAAEIRVRLFPVGYSAGRENDIELWPEQCEEVPGINPQGAEEGKEQMDESEKHFLPVCRTKPDDGAKRGSCLGLE